MNKDKINWEERRFICASMILSGMAANYQNPVTPGTDSIKFAIVLAEKLIQSICPELYQRDDA